MAEAISEMFVHRSGNDVYIAYGIPKEWNAASCSRLTIEGGHKISMELFVAGGGWGNFPN